MNPSGIRAARAKYGASVVVRVRVPCADVRPVPSFFRISVSTAASWRGVEGAAAGGLGEAFDDRGRTHVGMVGRLDATLGVVDAIAGASEADDQQRDRRLDQGALRGGWRYRRAQRFSDRRRQEGRALTVGQQHDEPMPGCTSEEALIRERYER